MYRCDFRKFVLVLIGMLISACAYPVFAQTVSVSVTPTSKTVKAYGNGTIKNENKATFTIKASFDPKSLETQEHKPGEASWTCTVNKKEFIPPPDVEPVPAEPKPSVSVSDPDGASPTWTSTVSSKNAGQWRITYEVTVTYKKIKKSDNTEDGVYGPFSGRASCLFTAIENPFIVEISVDPVVCRRSTKPAKRPFKKVTATLKDADGPKTIEFTSIGNGQVCFGDTGATATAASITKTIPKDGSVEFYISGEKESNTTNGTIIQAEHAKDGKKTVVGATHITVLWVTLTLRYTGKVSDDNSAREEFALCFDPINEDAEKDMYRLGQRIIIQYDAPYLAAAFEIKGEVKPSDFSESVFIKRDVQDTCKYGKTAKPEEECGFSNEDELEEKANDVSRIDILDTSPPTIYDLDSPCTNYEALVERIPYLERIFNAKQFAQYGDDRCSDVKIFSIWFTFEVEEGTVTLFKTKFKDNLHQSFDQ